MILLLVAFKQTSSDIKTRATSSRAAGASSTQSTVNFRTNPDLTSATTTNNHRRRTTLSVPKVDFDSLGASSSSETVSKRGSLKTELQAIELEPRMSTNSEKAV